MFSMGKASVAACLLLVGIAGCSGEPAKDKVFAVTGKVTAAGGSVDGALISFSPVGGGDGASATIGAGGVYTLLALDGRSGCPAGKFKVVLRPGAQATQDAMKNMSGPGAPKVDSKIPPAFAEAATSPKEVEVKAESNVIDIAI